MYAPTRTVFISANTSRIITAMENLDNTFRKTASCRKYFIPNPRKNAKRIEKTCASRLKDKTRFESTSRISTKKLVRLRIMFAGTSVLAVPFYWYVDRTYANVVCHCPLVPSTTVFGFAASCCWQLQVHFYGEVAASLLLIAGLAGVIFTSFLLRTRR